MDTWTSSLLEKGGRQTHVIQSSRMAFSMDVEVLMMGTLLSALYSPSRLVKSLNKVIQDASSLLKEVKREKLMTCFIILRLIRQI